jgi:hypothetical protein
MLSNITWKEYVELVVTTLLIYYCYIAVRYYLEDLKRILKGRFKIPAAANEPAKDPAAGDTVEELHAVVNDLKYAVLDKAGKETGKGELLARLKFRLANYAGLQKPAFRVAINNYIILHAQEICGIAFSADELNTAWDSLPQ